MTATAARPTAAPPSPWARLRPATVDRLLAALATVVLAPVASALGVWIRAHDGGPPLIVLPRAGRHGRAFGMWKLRTMRVDGGGGRAAGAALTAGGGEDPRITGPGRWLRRHRLDEVPQLVNVVRGQMALIGPRPEAPELVDVDDARWQQVLAVPPGITGATQLVVADWEETVMAGGGDHVARYRDEILPVKLAIDAWYVRSATARLDATILVAMIQRFLLSRPTTVVDELVRRAVPEARAVTREAGP